MALSTIGAKYMASTHVSTQEILLQILCSSMGLVQKSIRIDSHNESEILFTKNSPYHLNTKRIDVQYHFVRDMVEEKKVLLVRVENLKNTRDAFTKYVSIENFSRCRETMGIPWFHQ